MFTQLSQENKYGTYRVVEDSLLRYVGIYIRLW